MDLDDAYTLRILEPKDVRLFRSSPEDSRVRLTVRDERSWVSVAVSRAFPFSNAGKYFGLQDGGGGGVGLLTDKTGLDAESQAIISGEMDRRYFTPTVERVTYVLEQQGTVTWEVETDRGPRRFVVRNIRDNAYSLGPTRVMLTDSEGNRYYFADIAALGAKAYEVLAKVM
jgi:hypothetical protein